MMQRLEMCFQYTRIQQLFVRQHIYIDLLWVSNRNIRVDLERNTFVGIPISLDSNINNAVTTNFSLLMFFETMFK